MARTTTVLATEPPMTKPPIITSLPVRTCPRVEMFDRCAELGGATDPPQLPVTEPVPLKLKLALAAQPAVMAICVGLALPNVSGVIATPPTYSGDWNDGSVGNVSE